MDKIVHVIVHTILLVGLITGMMVEQASGDRIIQSLNGTWEIEESGKADAMPDQFGHQVQVPGLVKLTSPSFPNAGEFYTREFVMRGRAPDHLDTTGIHQKAGSTTQQRNYFWYRTGFKAPQRKDVAILEVKKAQFGSAVWVNGSKIGEHHGCFTAGYFDITEAVNWNSENTLVIRIGAHPNILPVSHPTGTDYEKREWTPGIYDAVSIAFSNNPVIKTVQVAPRINTSEVVVQTTVKNYDRSSHSFTLNQTVKPWKSSTVVATGKARHGNIRPGEEKTFTQWITIPNAKLWTPESPSLYNLETATDGDTKSTRFGMREFHFDTETKKAYLNGNIYYMRGSNITLHRFFEDTPENVQKVWDEDWVRKLLAEIPQQLHWNSFRFCIGPVPDMWLDIADETGLLIQNEYFIWNGVHDFRNEWTAEILINEYQEWMRDNWNHPSVAIWDACNETYADLLGEQVIPAVRHLDLSNRPWENGYNIPVGVDDPVEDHPYLHPDRGFQYSDLERMTGSMRQLTGLRMTAHPLIVNEYGWLWLNRDGTPTELTHDVYNELLGPGATPEQRLEMQAYLLAGETEYLRAHRNYAGVLHFVYLTVSGSGAYTADHFQNVQELKLHPQFKNYMKEAFKPIGVYLNFWDNSIQVGEEKNILVSIINDTYRTSQGQLILTLQSSDGSVKELGEQHYTVPALGQHTFKFKITVPENTGDYLLKAAAHHLENEQMTVSRRKVSIVNSE